MTSRDAGRQGYAYVRDAGPASARDRRPEQAIALGKHRLDPPLTEPDYLLLRARRRFLVACIESLPARPLSILDVGGRIQPYRPLFGSRVGTYVAVDPQMHGLVDVVAEGEHLPFADESFDVVLCTQVLTYVRDPPGVIAEMRRVLRPGGTVVLTAPAFFPCHHDERWRFLPEGLELLFQDFHGVRVVPEGGSIAGICRTIAVGLRLRSGSRIGGWIARAGIPLANVVGRRMDRFSRDDTTFTANFGVVGVK